MQVITSLTDIDESQQFDVVVIGAGGAGMAAALFAAINGKKTGVKVLLVEHTEYVGGTTALSAGTTWVPGTYHAQSVNPKDTLEDAARYLTHAIGEHSPLAMRQAFLDNGAVAIEFLEVHSDVKFRPYPKHPDYISDLPGSTLNGRALEPLPFDGRLLGDYFKLVRPPIPEFTVLGGMMVDRTDINHLLGITKSLHSLAHSFKIILRHAIDRLQFARGTRLVMGNALVARLLFSLSKHNHVSLALNTSVAALNGSAITLKQGEERRTIRVKAGVILASGGFNRHPHLRSEMLGNVDTQWCPAAPGHTGAAQDLARVLGAHYGAATLTNAFWAPVSLRKREDGSLAAFPHFVMDRAKPGMITVNSSGLRFVNESTSYHLFALAMQKSNAVPAFLICDADALRKYGMGMVRPGARSGDRALKPFLQDDYLTEAQSLKELAQKLKIDDAALQETVTRFNTFASTGNDLDFQRGTTAYQQNIGDPAWTGKNPNLGALVKAPFYAIRLYPGDIGASTGLVTDTHARALDQHGQPIQGLYAVGNDMHSIMGGVYTAPGITIGPGLVFGYLAAKHATQP